MTLPVISLFSGAGGLDLGVADAGGDIRICVEPNSDCVASLKANETYFPDAKILDVPIEYVTGEELLECAGLKKGEAALLVGGPPCQPFSKAGYWLKELREGAEDSRAINLYHYLRILKAAEPAGFILENVASIMHPAHSQGLEWFVFQAERLGYKVTTQLVQAVEYGVPQSRSRVFVVGLRGDAKPRFAMPTNWWQVKTKKEKKGLRPPETSGRWIGSFDHERYSEKEESVRGRWADALSQVPPGKNYKVLTAWAGHPEPLFVTETKYWSFLLKLSPFRPSWTIQAQPGPWTGPFHWGNRRLRTVEFASLQTFPKSYVFSGARRSKIKQIGNAVPPLLASRITAGLLNDIAGSGPSGRHLSYRLSRGFPFDAKLLTHSGPRW